MNNSYLKNKISIEKKLTIGTIFTLLCIICAGFITLGETSNQISTLNKYMNDNNNINSRIAAIEVQVQYINNSLDRIENYLIKANK